MEDKDTPPNLSKRLTNAPVQEALATIGEVFAFAETWKTRLYLVLGAFFAFVAGSIMPASLWYFSRVMGNLSAVSEEGLGPVVDIVYAMIVLGVVGLVSETMYAGLLETAANDMTMNLKEQWFEAVVRQDMTYFDFRDMAETANVISTNGEKFKAGISHKFGRGIQFTCTVLVGFALAFYSSWKVSLAVIAVMPVIATTTGFLMKLNQSKSARDNASYAKAGAVAYQVAANVRTVLALNAAEEMIDRYTAATKQAYDASVSQLTFLGLANGSLMASFMLAYIMVCGYGTFILYDEVRQNGCDPTGAIESNVSCGTTGSDIFLALGGVVFGGANLPQVSSAIEGFAGSRAACFPAMLAIFRKSDTGNEIVDAANLFAHKQLEQRSEDTILPKYEIDTSSTLGEKPAEVKGNIEFHEVQFAYPTRQNVNVLENFTLKIDAGKTVALVGSSGSGKSTVVQLIERYYDPICGNVTLDGVDLRKLNVEWLRSHIGLVSQEPTLFSATIKENIRVAKPDASDEEVEAAARQANAHGFISSLQDGYDTQVGDKGAQLSGGQKQRVAIARTLISKPKIILLDEATSALDSESEAIVQEALDMIMSNGETTVIVIAHRLSTIRNADTIAVVSQGKIVEIGTHEELLGQNGHYYDLVEAQKGKRANDQSSQERTSNVEIAAHDVANPSSCLGSEGKDSVIDWNESESIASSTAVVDVRNVHFTYPSRPDNEIFRGLGLTVKDGETLAIVGPSGQGKSTIIQLLEEFYRPTKGRIAYKGDDIKDLNVRWYRNEIGLVSQEPTLFDGTVAENIKFGMPRATQAEVEEAARHANAHQFISTFPDGYNTRVGTASSSQMSGGQKQRIAIARALLRKPKVLLLDEATSALDSESEMVVQDALDDIMKDSDLITVVIAHRLSTIRRADKIVYFDNGKVREAGTYDELMSKTNGAFRRLEELQALDGGINISEILSRKTAAAQETEEMRGPEENTVQSKHEEPLVDEEKAATSKNKARELARQEVPFFVLGGFGAILAGLTFPGQGIVMANMLEALFQVTLSCEDGSNVPGGFLSCQEYWDFTADEMKDQSLKTIALIAGLISISLLGNLMVFKGFGTATERINKRVRDLAFKALIRQEVAWYDMRSVGQITTQLSDDAAILHSFSGEPIRTFALALASVGTGLTISFVFMWEFAFVALGILPFMTFGRAVQRSRMMGRDEGDLVKNAQNSSEGAIVVETLVNIRVVASLCMEKVRVAEYRDSMRQKVGNNSLITNCIHNIAQGLGSFCLMNGYALLFYFAGWCLENRGYDVKDCLTALFGLMMSLSGLAAAMSGLTDSGKAREAAIRIFDLIERTSEIDPLSDEGKKYY